MNGIRARPRGAANTLLALAIATTLGAASGCTVGAWRDRACDLAQIVDFSGSVGPGVAISLRATELFQVGFGSFAGVSAGLIDGRAAAVSEERREVGISLLHTYEYERESGQLLAIRPPRFSDPGYDPHPFSWQVQSDRRVADIGFDVHAAYLGVNATIHLDELWDFVAGCFGFDPLRDDAFGRPVDDLRRQCASLDSSIRDRAFDALKRRGEGTHGYAIYGARDVRPSAQRRAIEEVTFEIKGTPPRPSH